MAIKFKYEGIEFEVSTPREAAHVVRELRRQQQPQLAPTSAAAALAREYDRAIKETAESFEVIKARLVNAAKDTDEERIKTTLGFLRNLRAAGSRGLRLEEVMKILQVKHAKGLGPRSLLINNVLREFGVPAEEVYRNERTPHGRLWRPGPHVQDAIAALERANELQKELLPQN